VRFISYMTPGFPESLFAAFADQIGAELHLDSTRSGPVPGDDPFADGSFDLGWVCSTSYVGLSLDAREPSVQLAGVAWVPDDPDVDGRPVYFGDVVVAPHIRAQSLADLRGWRIGCNDPVSLSGHYALRFALQERGEDPDAFASLEFTGGHHTSLDAVLAGDLDAAVIDSVVRIGRARHDPRVAALRVVERLGPWPVQPLVARSTMATAELEAIRSRLLETNDLPHVQAQMHNAALSRLVAVDRGHYAPVRDALSRQA